MALQEPPITAAASSPHGTPRASSANGGWGTGDNQTPAVLPCRDTARGATFLGSSRLQPAQRPSESGQPCTTLPSLPSTGKSGRGLVDVGHLRSKYPKHWRRLVALSANGNGVLDEDEVEAALVELVKAQSQNRLLRWIVLALCVTVVLLIGATVGVAVAAAFLAKDTRVTANSLLIDTDTGYAVAVGPCALRSLPAMLAIEQALAETTTTATGHKRSMMASDQHNSNVYASANDAVADGVYATVSEPVVRRSAAEGMLSLQDPETGVVAVGSQAYRRRLQQTSSAYGWVNGYVAPKSYQLDSQWLSNHGLTKYSRVLVVGSDTSSDTITALSSQLAQWCPDLSGVTPSTRDPQGFFLTTYYCKIVKDAQAAKTGIPSVFSCGCRLAVARTVCPETSDPNQRVNLTCAHDPSFFLDFVSNTICQVTSYRCPATLAAVQSLIAQGTKVFGSVPNWEFTSGGSISSTGSVSGGSDDIGSSQDTTGANRRRLTQWDTDPGSVTLTTTTTNTQSNGGSNWG